MKVPKFKIQSLESLREEMRAVARGERPPPPDAGMITPQSFLRWPGKQPRTSPR